MASANPDVQFTPAPRKKQAAQVKETLAETEQDDDPDEGDDAAFGLTPGSVSPSKRAMAGDVGWPAVVGRIVRYVGFSRKTALEEPQDLTTVEGGGEVDRIQTITKLQSRILPTPEAPTPQSTALKSPNRASGSLANLGKRRRSPRPDLYEVEDNAEPEEAPTNRPAKRSRTNPKAKTPLTMPKTSKGYSSSRSTRQTRGNHVSEGEVGTTANVPATSLLIRDKAKDSIETEQPKPRARRGRPPKNKNTPSEVVQNGAVGTPNKIVPANQVVFQNMASSSHADIVFEATEEDQGVIAQMFTDPSHIKVVRREIQRSRTATKRKLPEPKEKGIKIVNGMMEVTDGDEDEVEENRDRADENKDMSNDMEAEAEQKEANISASKPGRCPIDLGLLDRMLVRAKHVGHKLDTEEETYAQIKDEILWTGPGKRMDKQLKRLITSYGNLKKLGGLRNNRAFSEEHKKIEDELVLLKGETENVLTSRFGTISNKNHEKVTKMLKDLYFHILPRMILAVQEGLKAYDNKGSMDTPALQEISNLVELLHNLASAAKSQPKEIQPKPDSKISTYQISQPTRKNLPDIRSLQEMISVELRSREKAQKRAKDERLRPERERQRREKEEREESEFRRKREERRRLQGQSWRALQDNYFSPLWGQVLQDDLARVQAKSSSQRQESAVWKGKGRQESVELGYAHTHSVESLDRDDSDIERVSVFPENNIRGHSGLKSLSEEDTLTFIDCMRYEQVEDKYERAAEQIGRSMDEVFAFAKEFQEVMDLEHRQARFNKACDHWTYSVWVEHE